MTTVLPRRSKRSHHASDDDHTDVMSLSDASSHPVKVAKGAAAGRRPLIDVTNRATTRHAAAAAAADGKKVTINEEVVEEAQIKTRAQSRSTKAQQPSPKKMKLAAGAPTTRAASSKLAAPIQLGEEDEEEEAEEDASMEEDEEMLEAHEADSSVARAHHDASSFDEDTDADLASSKSSEVASAAAAASIHPAHSHATDRAMVPARAPVAFEDLASWQQCLDDPCQEYADSIYAHLRTSEMALFPDPLYMDKLQGDLTHAMRSILIDWLVEVATEYKLKAQTLFLAVAYLDRFLSRVQIDRSRLQLVGVTAMLLAAKYWEIWPPAIDEFVYISDKTYRKEEVLAMENAMLTCLQFKLTSPTSWEFSRRFCKAADADKKTEHLVDYLLELMLQESPSLTFRPSIIAASALFLSLYTLHLTPWSERLEIHTGIRVEELQTCVRIMHTIYVKTCVGQNTLRAVKEKYAADAVMQVALIKPRNM